MKQVYLDNAATTPVRLEVEVAMRPYFCEKYGNPSGAYQMSSENRGMIENVREQIAKTLNASAEEIYFTSGGTESDNWAIKSTAQMLKEKGRHIITSKIEHHAILNSCAYLEKQGFEVTYLDVDDGGVSDSMFLKERYEKTPYLFRLCTLIMKWEQYNRSHKLEKSPKGERYFLSYRCRTGIWTDSDRCKKRKY